MSNDAETLLSELKEFIKKSQTSKIEDMLNNYKIIKDRYCGKNLCDVDDSTKLKFKEFYEECVSKIKSLKKNIKGGKKRKTSRRYKKKSLKNQKGGINLGEAVLGSLIVTIFYIGAFKLGIDIKPEDIAWLNDLFYDIIFDDE